MPNKLTYSPTPWRIDENTINALDIVDCNDVLVAIVISNNDDKITPLARANAKAIVSYVNSCSKDD